MPLVFGNVRNDLRHRLSSLIDSVLVGNMGPSKQYANPSDTLQPGVPTYLAAGMTPSPTCEVVAVGSAYDPVTGQLQLHRPNQDLVLLTSAARTTQTDSPVQQNMFHRGVLLVLNVTAASGTGGLTVNLQTHDPVDTTGNTNWVNIGGATAPVTATGIKTYLFYPGAVSGTGGGLTQVSGLPLPRTWHARVSVADASSYTYSLSALTIA